MSQSGKGAHNMSGLDKAFGVSPQVLALRTQKLNLLSANIANASTPDYKARDIDFRAAMDSAMTESSQLKRTHSAHFDLNGATDGAPVKYRTPSQASVNGNTVEMHREHTAFMDNAMRYQASTQFLDSKIRALRTAIKGE